MKKYVVSIIPLGLLALLLFFILPSCSTTNQGQSWEKAMGQIPTSPLDPRRAHQDLNIQIDLIPEGRFGRRLFRPMKPQFITIHSTQNYTGDAFAHAKALKKGALRGGVCGYLCWHFTVQGDAVIQHVPTSERGEHADFDGPGNRFSIGIEMCEHKGNDMLATMDRTAKLAASLMYHHDIPITNVVAHYHWPRAGYNPANKNCPHFLMEDGQPREAWQWFKSRVERHHSRLALFHQQNQQKIEEQRQREKINKLVRWFEKLGSWLGLS